MEFGAETSGEAVGRGCESEVVAGSAGSTGFSGEGAASKIGGLAGSRAAFGVTSEAFESDAGAASGVAEVTGMTELGVVKAAGTGDSMSFF